MQIACHFIKVWENDLKSFPAVYCIQKKTLSVILSVNGSKEYVSKHGGDIKEEYLSVRLNDLSIKYKCEGYKLTTEGKSCLESDLFNRMLQLTAENKG